MGFAGGVADAITLEEMFEDKLKQFKGTYNEQPLKWRNNGEGPWFTKN